MLTDFSGSGHDDYAYAVVIQKDGKVAATGYSFASGTTYDFALARYVG